MPTEVLHRVEELERSLVTSACATIACTTADANVFRSWGAPMVVEANNGALRKSRRHLVGALPPPLEPAHRFALFIGSNYLPNISGFLRYVAPALPRLRPATRIVVAGSVCEALDSEVSQASLRGCREGRLVSLGFVDDLTLDALIANASALLLPIEYGGGSHLKTAEALLSGRPIIGTSTSFRGYTAYQELPHVILADTPERFESAIHHSLSCGLPLGDDLLPRELLWESTLEPVVQLARHLSGFRARHYELLPAN